jgi:PAS domain S-box-containing protein
MSNKAKLFYSAIEYGGLIFCLGLVVLGSGRLSAFIPWRPLWEEVFFWQAVFFIIIALIKFERGKEEKIKKTQVSYETEEQFLTMYDRSPTPYLIINREGVILKFNQAAILLFESTGSALGKANLFSFVDSLDHGDVSILVGKIQNGLTIDEQEVCIHTSKGGERWVLLSTYEFQTADERLVALVDVTQQKIVDRAKSEFVALATHQLRTPISAIRWNVELLERNLSNTKTSDQDRYLLKINRNVKRMIALINDFLSVSKLETGSFATTLEAVPLAGFFASVVDEYTENITEKRLQLSTSFEPADFVFTTDKHLLHIIVSNLVSNAVKYSTHDGYLHITYRLEAGSIRIEVANQGIGIPPQEIGNLFTKFYRATNAQAHHTEGTGLGLYVVKQSTEKLGGTIEVASVENGETKFAVQLPV